MEDLLILGGALALVLLLGKGGSANLTVTASAPNGLLTPMSVSGGALISGGYQTAPRGTGNVFGGLAGGVTGLALPSTVSPAPAPAPPPSVVGGAAGNAGTGGIPLGALRLGLAPILSSTVPSRAGWLLQHRLPNNGFGRVPGLSRVPVVFA